MIGGWSAVCEQLNVRQITKTDCRCGVKYIRCTVLKRLEGVENLSYASKHG